MITAQEAIKITTQSIDTSKDMNKQKLETIEKRIRKASARGLRFIWYEPMISYFMYETLINNGYKVEISRYSFQRDKKFELNLISHRNDRQNLITWYLDEA